MLTPSSNQRPADIIEVLVLGVAQDGGMPQIGCECANCRPALAEGLYHPPAGLAVQLQDANGASLRALVDAGPELRTQLRRFPGRVDAVLLTHLHMGHYPGILEFGREVTGRQGLEIWCSPAVADVLETNSPWRELATQGHVVYRRFVPGQPFAPLPGLDVWAYRVPHRNEIGDTVGFVLRPAGVTRGGVLYLPDADQWEGMNPSLVDLVAGVDVALLDATFYDRAELSRITGRPPGEVPHPPAPGTVYALKSRGLANRVAFLHLNHTNPLWRADSEQHRWVTSQGARVAAEGDVYELTVGQGTVLRSPVKPKK